MWCGFPQGESRTTFYLNPKIKTIFGLIIFIAFSLRGFSSQEASSIPIVIFISDQPPSTIKIKLIYYNTFAN